MAKEKKTSGKTERIAELKVLKELEVGVPTKGSMLLTPMGQCIFTPATKMNPDDYKGMRTVMQTTAQIGSWSLCESKEKIRLSVVVPKTNKDLMIEAMRSNMTDAIYWAQANYVDKPSACGLLVTGDRLQKGSKRKGDE